MGLHRTDLRHRRRQPVGIHAVAGFNLIDRGRVDEGLENYSLSLELARLRQQPASHLVAWHRRLGLAGRKRLCRRRQLAQVMHHARRLTLLDLIPPVARHRAG